MLTRRELTWLFASGGVSLALGRRALAAGWSGYADAMVIDALGDYGDPGESDPYAPLSDRVVAHAKASGVTAINLTLAAKNSYEDTIRALAAVEREIELHPDAFLKIKRAADLKTAKAGRRCGLIYGLQDLSMVGEDLERIEVLHRLGVRIIQPTYNLRNLLADGCLEPRNAGYSKLGRAALERMQQLRIVLDLSHCGQRSTAEAIATANGPVAITHTGCAAVHDHPRNKRDAELRACAERGGVVGIYLMPFLRAQGPPTAEDVLRHLEHAIDVCGEDHVGIGTDGSLSPVVVDEKFKVAHRDFVKKRKAAGVASPGEDENVYNFVADLNTPRRMETIAELLLQRKHPESRVAKILGGNFARLFSEVWG